MAAKHYDVIVAGARYAGSPTAMLLARQGYRVHAVMVEGGQVTPHHQDPVTAG